MVKIARNCNFITARETRVLCENDAATFDGRQKKAAIDFQSAGPILADFEVFFFFDFYFMSLPIVEPRMIRDFQCQFNSR